MLFRSLFDSGKRRNRPCDKRIPLRLQSSYRHYFHRVSRAEGPKKELWLYTIRASIHPPKQKRRLPHGQRILFPPCSRHLGPRLQPNQIVIFNPHGGAGLPRPIHPFCISCRRRGTSTPACFLAKSADALKKRVALFLSAKKRNRVRKDVKRKGIDRRHAETRADLNCTNFEEGGTRPAYTPPVKDGSFSKQRSCGTSIL